MDVNITMNEAELRAKSSKARDRNVSDGSKKVTKRLQIDFDESSPLN